MAKVVIDKGKAAEVFDVAVVGTDSTSPRWIAHIEKLSRACEGAPKTHIAFIGTALLAKSVSVSIDARIIKSGEGSAGAYSARSLAKDVLVPKALAAGVDLGVSGREPLNNQPYFRISRVDEHAPIHGKARVPFQIVLELLAEIDAFQDEDEARAALSAFIHVRRRFIPTYPSLESAVNFDPRKLASAIQEFVAEKSEGGKRAQAVVAGLLDSLYPPDRVDSGRINDPSRHYPGDVVVWAANGRDIEKAVEVRDKLVAVGDALIFLRKAADAAAADAIVVACSSRQQPLDEGELIAYARSRGVEVTLFYDWGSLVRQVLLWSSLPQWQAAAVARNRIAERLTQIEVEPDSLARWGGLVSTS